jgi:hypothetical protein
LLARVGRTLAVAVAAAALLVLPVRAGAAATGCSPGGACVAIHEFAGGTDNLVRTVTGSELDALADHTDTTCYHTRATPTQTPTCHNVSNALSIQALLAGTPDPNSTTGQSLADTANFTATPRADGSWSLLTQPELQGNTSGTFEDGLLPVVHSIGDLNGGPIEYVRPLTTAPSDANAQDIFTLGDASDTLVINVFTGPLLVVKVTTKSTHVQVGKPVSFTATARDHGTAVSPKSLTYSWSFGDGGTAATQDPTYRFKTAGTWLVRLTATGTTDGSGGMSTPLLITAGPPPTKTSPSPKPGPGKSPTPSPSSSPGPVASTTPTPGPDPSPHAGSGHGGGGGGPQIPKLDNGAVSRLFSRLSGQGAGRQPKVATGTDGLQLISGQIVSVGAPLSASQAASESSTLARSPVDGETTRWSPGVVPIYVAVTLLLLGIGIARERGWLTLRRR